MAALDLCTREDVKALLGLSVTPGEDTDYDDLIDVLVTRASEQARDRTGCELIDSGAGLTRKFDFDVFASVRELPIGDAKTVSSIEITDAYSTAIYSSLVEDSHYTLLPRNREPWQPIERVRFLPYMVTLDAKWIAVVTGTWGWPSIPSNIVHAVAYAVKTWVERDVRSFAQTAEAINLDAAKAAPRILPLASVEVFDSVARYGV